MNLLEVRYTIGNEEVVELQTEEDFLQFVTQLCWEKFQWTPLLEICDGVIFVHSDTWEDNFFSKYGADVWREEGIDFETESDVSFFNKLKKYLRIETS